MTGSTLDPSKPIVQGNVTPEIRETLKKVQAEGEGENIQTIPEPENDKLAQNKEVNLDQKKADPPKTEEGKKPDESNKSETDEGEKLEENKKGAEPHRFKVTIGGEEKELTYHEIKSAIGRSSALQKQLNQMNSSEEMKLGTLMAAAKSGDKKAGKKAHDMLVAAFGKESAEDLIDELSGVEGDFDEGQKLSEREKEAQFDQFFDDVKDDVDFETHMTTVNESFPGRVPAKVFEAYNNEPHLRRTMYDLAASGRADEILSAVDAEINSLPFEKQLEVRSNPDLYGDAFFLVVNKLNASKQAKKEKTEDPEKDALDSISGGNESRRSEVATPQGEVPDFLKMSAKEFAEYKEKAGIPEL